LMSYATAAADQSLLIQLARTWKVMLVVDESHRIKRFKGGVWAPALMRIAQFARVRVVLSGTPMPQSGRDLYSQLTVLWPGHELTGSRDAFAISVENDFPALLKQIQPFVSRAPKDALGLPPVRVHRHDVALNPLQSEIYELIETGLRRRLQEATSYQEKLDALRRGRPIRLLQAATNPDLLNRRDPELNLPPIESINPTLMDRLRVYREQEVPAKAVRALSLIESEVASGRKVVVWSNFVFNLDYLTNAIRATKIPCYQIDGRIPVGDESRFDTEASQPLPTFAAETRESIIDSFLAALRPSVLVANPASCSESISLHMACRTAIYVDRTYDCALYLQSIDRIHRLGLPADAEVNVHLLMATNAGRPTIDDLVDASLIGKETRMRQLLEGDNEDLAQLLRYLLGEER
jgi:SNF2 family DNA or RNA helicase